jgi:hypothetical protein
VHTMQAHNPLDHTRMQIPYQQCHNNGILHSGVNHSGNGLHLGPRTPALFSNSEQSFGPPQHPFLVNPVNHRNVRILPPLVSLHFTLFSTISGIEISNYSRSVRVAICIIFYDEISIVFFSFVGNFVTSSTSYVLPPFQNIRCFSLFLTDMYLDAF